MVRDAPRFLGRETLESLTTQLLLTRPMAEIKGLAAPAPKVFSIFQ